jgi:hypothetical protein
MASITLVFDPNKELILECLIRSRPQTALVTMRLAPFRVDVITDRQASGGALSLASNDRARWRPPVKACAKRHRREP